MLTSHKPFAYRLSTTVSGVDFWLTKKGLYEEGKKKRMVDYPVIKGVRREIVICETPVFVLTRTREEDSDQFEIHTILGFT